MPKLTDMPFEHRDQCNAFLKELRRTANIKLSAERVGVPYQTLNARRSKFPAFATRWDAALAYARAHLAKHGALPPQGASAKTQGGEYTVTKQRHGCLQVKRARAGHLTADGERMFLETLAATANVKLASDTVGISDTSIYSRRMKSDLFADKMDAALEHGYERLETEMLESATASLDPTQLMADWIEGATQRPSPLLRMNFEQVIIRLGLYRKRVTLREDRRAHNRRVYRAEETDAEITKLIAQLNRRAEQKDAREQRMAEREGRLIEGPGVRAGAGRG